MFPDIVKVVHTDINTVHHFLMREVLCLFLDGPSHSEDIELLHGRIAQIIIQIFGGNAVPMCRKAFLLTQCLSSLCGFPHSFSRATSRLRVAREEKSLGQPWGMVQGRKAVPCTPPGFIGTLPLVAGKVQDI
jgi:hypothetical protein